jgi:hypothetical protein
VKAMVGGRAVGVGRGLTGHCSVECCWSQLSQGPCVGIGKKADATLGSLR